MIKYIAYYSRTYLKTWEQNLKPSLEKFNLDYYVEELKEEKDWKQNTDFKPLFIWQCLQKFPGQDLVYIDVDAKITLDPVLFAQISPEYDISCHFFEWEPHYGYKHPKGLRELLSGTLMLRNSPKVNILVQDWNSNAHRYGWEQKALAESIKKFPDIKVYELPREYCYDEQTEVLTDEGFKLFKNLNRREKIATLNRKRNEVEYHKPCYYYENDYNGDMIEIKTSKMNLLVTPDHNIFIKDKSNKEKIVKANYYSLKTSGIKFKRNFPWKDCVNRKEFFILPEIRIRGKNYVKPGVFNSFVLKRPQKEIKMDYWLKFLGWYLTEGWLSNCEGNNYKITICQSLKNGKHVKEIEKTLRECGFKFTTYLLRDVKHFHIYNKQLYTYLDDTCGRNSIEKKIDRWYINNLNTKQLKNLFNTLIKGDGHVKKNIKTYVTISERLANDIYEIGLKIGFNVSFNKSRHIYYTYFTEKNKWSHSSKRDNVNYIGKIYCLEVENHLIFVRRNGKSCWSGNCYISSVPSGDAPAIPLSNPIIEHYQASRKLKRIVNK